MTTAGSGFVAFPGGAAGGLVLSGRGAGACLTVSLLAGPSPAGSALVLIVKLEKALRGASSPHDDQYGLVEVLGCVG